MTGVALAAILAFGAGVIEGLLRGGGAAGVPVAALAGLVWAALAAGVLGLTAGVRWLLPIGLRSGAWPRAGALTAIGFVALEFVVARALALRFRDPALVALVAAAMGVVLAWVCALLVMPLVVRVVAVSERWAPGPRRARWLRGAGLAVVIGGAAALGWAGQGRVERSRSTLVARTLALAVGLTDINGDGDGLVSPPRGCPPRSPSGDGGRCAAAD